MPAEATWNSRTTSATPSARSCGTSGEAATFCWTRHNAHRLPSRAARKRSSGDRFPGGRFRHRIVNLPPATRDIDQAHVRVEDLEAFALSRAGDADVQNGEVEMRDPEPPELVHEPRVARFQIPRRFEVARADRPFDRDDERGHEGLDHQNGDDDTVGRLLLVREVVGVADTERPGHAPKRTHDSDRPEPLERPPLVVVQEAGTRSPRCRRDSATASGPYTSSERMCCQIVGWREPSGCMP